MNGSLFRRPAVLVIAQLPTRTVLQQRVREGHVIGLRGEHQGGPTLDIACVHVRALCQQQMENAGRSVGSCKHEESSALFVPAVHSPSCPEHLANRGEIVTFRSPKQSLLVVP